MPQIDHVFFFSQIICCFIVNLFLLILLIRGYGLLFSTISKLRSNFIVGFELFQFLFRFLVSIQLSTLSNFGSSSRLLLVLKSLMF